MKETIKTIMDWQEQTFPDATLEGQLEKYQEEQQEFIESNYQDVSELADMFIVACGIARFDIREGSYYFADIADWMGSDIPIDWQPLQDAVDQKMAKNRKRVWNKTAEGTYHHENGIED
jgi:hypothetical protein